MQARKIVLFKAVEQWQMDLVTCFEPDRVNETSGYVSAALQHLPVCIESSVDALRSVLHKTVF